MINVGKETHDVGLQAPFEATLKMLCSSDRAMRPLSHAACIAVKDELPFEDWFQYGNQSMVDNSISERCGTDFAWFRVANVKVIILSVFIRATKQIALQSQQVLFPGKIELRCWLTVSLSSATLVVRCNEVFQEVTCAQR